MKARIIPRKMVATVRPRVTNTPIDGTNYKDITPNSTILTSQASNIIRLTSDGTQGLGWYLDQNNYSHAITVKLDGSGYTDLTPKGSINSFISGKYLIHQTNDLKWHLMPANL